MIYTGTYSYRGQHRLDVSWKGRHPVGTFFAPSISMLNGYKSGKVSKEEYTKMYIERLISKLTKDVRFKEVVLDIVRKQLEGEDITFVCFCKAGCFCHRVLLAEWFVKHWPVTYGGEVSLLPVIGGSLL